MKQVASRPQEATGIDSVPVSNRPANLLTDTRGGVAGPAIEPRTRRPRRWMQFSLLTLLALVSVMCVVLATWVTPAERQERAVEAIRAAGGTVRYDFEEAKLEAP